MCIVSKFIYFDIPLLVALSLSRSPNNIIVELNIYDAFIRSLCLTKSLLAFSLSVLCYDPLRSWRVVECHKFWWTLLAVWVDEHSSLDFIIIKKERTRIQQHYFTFLCSFCTSGWARQSKRDRYFTKTKYIQHFFQILIHYPSQLFVLGPFLLAALQCNSMMMMIRWNLYI